MQFYHFIQLFNAINQDGAGSFWEESITRDEVAAYYEEQGGMTEEEIADKVEEFFLKYNDGEDDGTGDDNIGKWEMWMVSLAE